jgi:hypothetical protein
MVKQLQPPQKLLWTVGDEQTDMGRTDKAKASDQSDDLAVAFGESHNGNFRSAVEAGKSGRLHPATLPDRGQVM